MIVRSCPGTGYIRNTDGSGFRPGTATFQKKSDINREMEMQLVKRAFLVVFVTFTLAGVSLAQEEIPRVDLTFSEQCNNFLRHYCVSGNHQRAVDYKLLAMKERGVTITVKLIKRTARTTPSGAYVPPPVQN